MLRSHHFNPWTLCVAPMMAYTDRHCRYFHRLLAPDARLYTEMLTAQALIHGNAERLLAFHPAEHPVALQLGGSEPESLARAARLGEQAGFDEINLNVGCPSDRVKEGRFGACLMREPQRVRDCLTAMTETVDVPVTIKTRIGVDHHDSYEFLTRFIVTIIESGCSTIIVHARKAWLSGLSPKQNREIPPLAYQRVYRLKADFPHLNIVVNGGIVGPDDAASHLAHCDGVMMGRSAYQTPWRLAQTDAALFGHQAPDRTAVVQAMAEYAGAHLRRAGRLSQVTRHLLGLYQGQPGARRWRRRLSEHAHRPQADEGLLLNALDSINRTTVNGVGKTASGNSPFSGVRSRHMVGCMLNIPRNEGAA